jgi:hypothetical protein
VNFLIDDFISKSGLPDTDTLVARKIDRINWLFDFHMQLIFGENWKTEESNWGFKRDFKVSEDEHKVNICAALCTNYYSADTSKVNEAMLAIHAGKDVTENRQFLRQCLESERVSGDKNGAIKEG